MKPSVNMNKTLLLTLFIFNSAVISQVIPASLTYYWNDVRPDGYSFAYRTADGVIREEQGYFRNSGTDNEIWEVQGRSVWTDMSGKQFSVSFISNENGYQTTSQKGQKVESPISTPIPPIAFVPLMTARGGLTG